MIAFFDASALIYLIEGKEPFAARVRESLAALATEHGKLGAAVSRLTWLETRVAPLRASDTATLTAYDAFFARPDLTWIELTRDVVELAAAIRARHGLRAAHARCLAGSQLPAPRTAAPAADGRCDVSARRRPAGATGDLTGGLYKSSNAATFVAGTAVRAAFMTMARKL